MTGGQLDEALAAVLQHIESTAVPQLTVEAEASGVNQAPSGEAESDLVQHPAHDQPAAAAQPAAEAAAVGSQMVEEPGCVFCGSLGNSDLCGLLQPAVVNGVPVMVHHLCALWAPQVYQQEGSQQYINLEQEYRRAERHVCTACGYTGAAIGCTEPGCKCTYHLPCAIQTPNVFLDVDAFELWCPVHADNEDDDMSDDYGSVQTSGRGRVRATAVSRRQRVPRGDVGGDVQRARTDWQKRDDNTWVKVVPPWWAEHKTVHFASKVYKELFRSAPSVVIVDSTGMERLCTLQTESRNDTRQQYTLRGRFAEFWEAAGVQAGDTLSFRYDPATAKVTVLRYAPAPSGVAEQGSVLSQPAATETTSVRIKQENSVQDLSTRGVSQQGSHPNRWMELNDGWCIKTVYKSTIAHQQCPVAGWLFRKLYGRLPNESDKAVMVDADLGTEYRFDVNFIGAANVHYITGRNFGAWMRESGLRAQEQIRVKKDGGRVLIQRVPSDMKVHVDFSNGRSTRASTRDRVTPPTSAGGTGPHSGGVSGNHSNPIMEALDSLAAAAGFAAVHGTPAIAAALAAPPAAAAAAAAAAVAAAAAGALPLLVQQQEQQLLQAGQQPGAPPSGPAAAAGLVLGDELQPQQSVRGAAELTLGKRRRTSTVNDSALGQLPVGGQGCGAGSGSLVWAPPFYQPNGQQLAGQSRQYPAQPFSPSKWESGHPHMQMYHSLLSMVGKHTWGSEEQDLLLKFKARYGRLDDVGREITFFNIRECHEDQGKLRTVLRVFAE